MHSLRVYDLDNTVIDSNHRKCTKSDGTLDLAHWIEKNTSKNIALDSLLPLVETMRKAYHDGFTVVILTARVLTNPDFEFFMEHDILFHHVLSRPQGCTMIDAELKDVQLRIFAQNQGLTWKRFCSMTIMYDDCQSVLTRMANIGVDCIDANKQNRLLRWAQHA